MYNINQLLTFVKVAELKSFNKASDEIFMSANAIMQQINGLEAELGGVKLFERSHRGIELTKAGKVLYEDALQIIDICETSKDKVRGIASADNNIVRIAVQSGRDTAFLENICRNVKLKIPDINIEMIFVPIIYSVASKIWKNVGVETDLFFGITDEKYIFNTQRILVIKRQPVLAAMNINHRLASKEILKTEDLRSETLVMIEPENSIAVDALRSHMTKKYRTVKIVNTQYYGTDIVNACASDNSIIIDPGDMTPNHPFIVKIPVEWNVLSSIGFVYSAEPTEATSKFIEAVKELKEEIHKNC